MLLTLDALQPTQVPQLDEIDPKLNSHRLYSMDFRSGNDQPASRIEPKSNLNDIMCPRELHQKLC